jgi:hypothetical protein
MAGSKLPWGEAFLPIKEPFIITDLLMQRHSVIRLLGRVIMLLPLKNCSDASKQCSTEYEYSGMHLDPNVRWLELNNGFS